MRISHLEKPAFILYGLLQLYSIRGRVCNNNAPTTLCYEFARPAVGKGQEKKKKGENATADFFNPVLPLFYLYTVFFKTKEQHFCSSVSISNAHFKFLSWCNSS